LANSFQKITTLKNLLFLFLLLSCNQILGQINIIKPSEYYEFEYFRENGFCWCKTFISDESLIEKSEIEGHIKFNAINTNANFKNYLNYNQYLKYDTINRIVLGYENLDLNDIDKVQIEEFESKNIFPSTIDDSYIDTVYITRKGEGMIFISQDESVPLFHNNSGSNTFIFAEYPYRVFQLLVVNNTNEFKNFVEVHIEFKDSDSVNKKYSRKIICPEDISTKRVKGLNSKLIELGYLSDDIRTKFTTEIREALYLFQEDFGLETGFLDKITLNELEIK